MCRFDNFEQDLQDPSVSEKKKLKKLSKTVKLLIAIDDSQDFGDFHNRVISIRGVLKTNEISDYLIYAVLDIHV